MYTYQPCPECRKINRISFQSLKEARKQPQCGSCKIPILMTGPVGEVKVSGLMALIEKCPVATVATFWTPKNQDAEFLAPTFFEAAEHFADEATFVRINLLDQSLAADYYNIKIVPTTIVAWKGFERARMAQPLQSEDFLAWLQYIFTQAKYDRPSKDPLD